MRATRKQTSKSNEIKTIMDADKMSAVNNPMKWQRKNNNFASRLTAEMDFISRPNKSFAFGNERIFIAQFGNRIAIACDYHTTKTDLSCIIFSTILEHLEVMFDINLCKCQTVPTLIYSQMKRCEKSRMRWEVNLFTLIKRTINQIVNHRRNSSIYIDRK